MVSSWPQKDPDEVLDYGFNWSPRMVAGDAIVSTSATVVSGTVDVESTEVSEVEGAEDDQGQVTWLSGGAAGDKCQILLRVVTAGGRTMDETLKITIKER